MRNTTWSVELFNLNHGGWVVVSSGLTKAKAASQAKKLLKQGAGHNYSIAEYGPDSKTPITREIT